MQEARQRAVDLTNAYKDQQASLSSQIERYKELKTQLDAENISTNEVRSIKEQLLELQNDLIESYGNESSNIDLVNGGYEKQIDLLNKLSQQKASDYVKENYSAFQDAKQEINKKRSFNLGSLFSYDSTKGMSKEQQALLDYVKAYSSQFEIRTPYDTSTLVNSDFQPTLFIKANADDAKSTISQFVDDIQNYINENGLTIDVEDILSKSSEALTKINTNETLEQAKNIYNEYLNAQILQNDNLRQAYQDSIMAVEEYNQALSSGEGVEEAKGNLDSVQQSVSQLTPQLEGSQAVFDSLYGSINKDAEAAYNLSQSLKNNDSVKELAGELKGLTDIDLKAINFEDNIESPGEKAFRSLVDILGLSKEQIDLLIEKLVEMGFVQGKVASELPASLPDYSKLTETAEAASKAVSSLRSAITTVNDAFAEQEEAGSISIDTMLSLTDAGYATALEFDSVTGACKINQETMLDLVEAKIQNQIADLEILQSDIASKLKDDGIAAAESVNGFLELANAKIIANSEQLSSIDDYNDAEARIKALQNTIKNLKKLGSENFSTGKSSTSKSSSDPLKDAFTKEYNTLKHNLDMEYITEEQYYNSLESLNKKYFAGKEDYLDDYHKYEEEIYKEIKKVAQETIDSQMNYLGKKLDAGVISYQAYSANIKTIIDDMYNQGKISAEDHFNYMQKMLEKQKSIYDKVISSAVRRLEKEIQKNQDVIDSIEKQNNALEKQKDKYDKVISAVQTLIDTKKEEIQSSIDSLEKENDALNKQVSDYDSVLNAVQKVYEEKQNDLKAEQDAIQERIDALQEENDEHKRAIELQKAKYELERSMNQRSQFVFDGEQFVYQADDKAIRENQETVADLELEQTISNMEKEKEALQELIDELDKYKNLWAETANAYQDIIDKELAKNILGENYDQEILLNRIEDIEAFKNRYITAQEKIDDNTSMIESYNEKLEYYENLKQKWEDLSSAKEESTNRQIASELLGQEWETLILEDRLTSFEEFADTYLSIQDQIDDNTSMIESYNEKIAYYENLKQQWSDISDAYQNAVDDQYAAMILGQNWEADVLSGRIETLNNFKNDYVRLQQAMADAAIESSNAQVKAYENAKNHAITANTSIPNSNDVSGNYGKDDNSGDKGKNHVSGGFDDSDIALVNPGYKPKPNVSKPSLRPQRLPSRYAEGGVISKKDSHPLFDSIAESVGEDHMVAVQEGEMILPANVPLSYLSSPLYELLSKSGGDIIRSSFLNFDSFSGSNTCNDLNFIGNDTQKNVEVNFGGDIVLQGVQDPHSFAKDLKFYISSAAKRELFRRM